MQARAVRLRRPCMRADRELSFPQPAIEFSVLHPYLSRIGMVGDSRARVGPGSLVRTWRLGNEGWSVGTLSIAARSRCSSMEEGGSATIEVQRDPGSFRLVSLMTCFACGPRSAPSPSSSPHHETRVKAYLHNHTIHHPKNLLAPLQPRHEGLVHHALPSNLTRGRLDEHFVLTSPRRIGLPPIHHEPRLHSHRLGDQTGKSISSGRGP